MNSQVSIVYCHSVKTTQIITNQLLTQPFMRGNKSVIHQLFFFPLGERYRSSIGLFFWFTNNQRFISIVSSPLHFQQISSSLNHSCVVKKFVFINFDFVPLNEQNRSSKVQILQFMNNLISMVYEHSFKSTPLSTN